MPAFPTPGQLSQQQREAAKTEAAQLRQRVQQVFEGPMPYGGYYVLVERYSAAAVAIIVEELAAAGWRAVRESDQREGSGLRISPA